MNCLLIKMNSLLFTGQHKIIVFVKFMLVLICIPEVPATRLNGKGM